MSKDATMTPEALADAAEAYPVDNEAAFTAVRVAGLLPALLTSIGAREAGMRAALSDLPETALDHVREVPLPSAHTVEAAVLAIRAAAAEPDLRPKVEAAMAEQAGSQRQEATTVLAGGVTLATLLLIAKAEVRRNKDGTWEVHLHKTDNKALVALANFVTSMLNMTLPKGVATGTARDAGEPPGRRD